MVLFIHRHDYQGLNEDANDVGRTQIIIAKHRNGAIGDIDMRFRADEVRFVDEQESLVYQAQAAPVASAMNAEPVENYSAPTYTPSQPGPSDEFAGASDFR
jgi:replicative DNA helicase